MEVDKLNAKIKALEEPSDDKAEVLKAKVGAERVRLKNQKTRLDVPSAYRHMGQIEACDWFLKLITEAESKKP